ncbi:MAG: DNA mismatch repair endonuclease MutL, partial [Bacilli bacterium]|nr:DNA mismatch repair endonuclease MutL [Bacilli bacterium]
MANIKQLDQHVANLIAAGEVIERAASVVKELVENSIDAHAKNISIHLIDSGLNEIRVIDDGDGMDSIDAKMCVLPHATSKIKNESDLFTIKTLGFRGEALPSIVAVSNFRLITSTNGQGALMYSLRGGVPMTEAIVAHDKGTEIVVKNLFFNTPARLQNLQAPNVELSHITDYVTKVSLSNPSISFTLTNNEKVILKTTGNGDLLEVIASILGVDCAKNMYSVFDTNGTYRVHGFISNISLTRSSKNYIFLFINGRVFRSYNVNNAILKGYDTLLMTGKFPIVVLNIEADPNLVDVNVH